MSNGDGGLVARIESFFVPLLDGRTRIRTLVCRNFDSSDTNSGAEQCTPIVMVHGMGAGVGMWVKNLDDLSRERPVYSFDLLGFGRSSRTSRLRADMDAKSIEDVFVASIEEWRMQMKMEKFILLGHSFGGYLSCAYSIRYPERVAHLILTEPWGFAEYRPPSEGRRSILFWLARHTLSYMNPLGIIRWAGPFGPDLVRWFRQDLGLTFNGSGDDAGAQSEMMQRLEDEPPLQPKDKTTEGCIYQYIYHCNAQCPASGEVGFKAMSEGLGWAKVPMLRRVPEFPALLPITFIYGSRSWMDYVSGYNVRSLRNTARSSTSLTDAANVPQPNGSLSRNSSGSTTTTTPPALLTPSLTEVMVVEGAGHHVYAQQAERFNDMVMDIARRVDQLELDDSIRCPSSCEDAAAAAATN